MPLLSQADIRSQYIRIWADEKKRSDAGSPSLHGSAAEDLVVQPIYLQLLRDLRLGVGDGRGHVLDVGCGAGRWVRFVQEQLRPGSLVGLDVTEQSIELLCSRHRSTGMTNVEFHVGDITDPKLDLPRPEGGFDLINIANVLFHIPEPDLYQNALANLRRHVSANGCVITTEYLPRTDMRTNWMLVRSRYNFEKLITQAGFRIAAIRAFTIFNNDPFGLDGPDDGPRALFNKARQQLQTIENSLADANGRAFFNDLQANLDRAFLAFCKERVADIELPSQKLVALLPS